MCPLKLVNTKQTDLEKIVLSDEQKTLFEKLENTNDTYFVTGKAGTGKSLLLQYFKNKSKKRLVVVAPTGVAAINVGGQTIHSLFRIPPSFIAKNSLRLDTKVGQLLRNIDTIVIDEISMVRADLMDGIDYLLRKARASDQPFGGVQIIMFGDLYQLPPVINDPELHAYFALTYGGFYFFNADVWKELPLQIVELSTIFRQKDRHFKDILDAIRRGKPDYMVLENLNNRAEVVIPKDGAITLAATNRTANEINEARLQNLKTVPYSYTAKITGQFEESAYPTEPELKLKKGAQIMMLKNDKDKRWVNGTLGTIEDVSDKDIKVNIDDTVHTVTPETWSKIRYTYNPATDKVEEEVVSAFTQYPIRLAWAITIHKSQGQTYQSVIIDLGRGAFAHGQTYVALSRCTNLETLYLRRPIQPRDLIVDTSIISFMEKALG